MSSSAIKNVVDDIIKHNKIVVFSKTYCPYCGSTKEYFRKQFSLEDVHVVELDTRDDCSAIQDYLQQIVGVRTVPQTFINGHHIGGNTDLQCKSAEEVKRLIDGPHI